jgi:hypothetical protein
MRTLYLSEVQTVYGGGQPNPDPAGNFSGGTPGCPPGYTGVVLTSTSTTYPSGAGLSNTASGQGATAGISTTATGATPTVTVSAQAVCFPNVPASGAQSGSAAGSAAGGAASGAGADGGSGSGSGGGGGGTPKEPKERQDDE